MIRSLFAYFSITSLACAIRQIRSRFCVWQKVIFISLLFFLTNLSLRAQNFTITSNLPNCSDCPESYTVVVNAYGKPVSAFVIFSDYVSVTCCYTDIFGECQNIYYECGGWHYSYTDFYALPDEDCGTFFNGGLTWEPSPTFLSNTSGTYCFNQSISLTAPSTYHSYIWQFSNQLGVWNTFSTTSSSSITFGIEDIFGANFEPYLYQNIYFRYMVSGCNTVSTPSGPVVFNAVAPNINSHSISQPLCTNDKNGIIRVSTIDRAVLAGEILTYTVYKPDNAFVAQISSNVTPSVSNPVVIDGSNPSVAPFGIGSGDYKILVTSNKSLCGAVTYYTVPTIPNPTSVNFTSGSSPPSCFGGTNGSINVGASGGTNSGYQYSKDGGTSYQAGSTFTGLSQGNYNIRVKDANGCLSGIAGVSVTQPADISATAAVTSNFNGRDISCFGTANGAITVAAAGGTGTLQYSRDGTTYQPSNVFSSLAAGSYTITVRDGNNCMRTSGPVAISSPPALGATVTPTAASCFGLADGSITVSASGGTGALQYSINGTTFQAGTSFNSLNANNYTVTIRDVNFCTTTQNTNVTQPLALVVTGNPTLVTCSGGNDGTVTINATNGTAPYTYSFNGGPYGTNSNFTNLSANSYAVSVKDSKGCIGNNSAVVTSNPVLTGSIAISNPISCNGGNNGALNLTPGGGVGPYTFTWSNGSVTEDISTLTAGTYSVTVKDTKNCTKAFNQTLTQPVPVTINYSVSDYNGANVRCFGNSDGFINLTTTGGNGGYSFIWSNGALTEDVTGLSAGTYTVNVLDSKSCPASQGITLTQPAQLTSSQTIQNPLCFGGNTGSITFLAGGGTGSYEYSINNGVSWQPAPSFNNLSTGSYQTLTRDVNNCQAAATRAITSPPEIVLTISNVQNTTCNQDNGSAQVNVTGGVLNYHYEWFNAGNVSIGTSSSINNLPAGTYRIVVTDQNACTKQQAVPISSSNGPQVTTQTILPASCSDTSDGSATINITGGATPYTISWPNGQSSLTATNLAEGTYLVEVRDNTNCLAIQSVTVTAPDELVINTLSQTVPNCAGNSDGQIAIEATGGNGTYSYLWNTGAITPALPNIPAGNYTVVVKDIKNCTQQKQLVLIDPQVFTVDLGPDQKICEGMEVNLVAQEDNATYLWTSANGFTSSNQSVQLTQAGTYTLHVTSVKGCEASDSFELIYDTNLLTADFLMTSEAHAGDTVILIDISWPLPEQTTWSYQASPTVVEETRDYAMIRYDDPGNYTVGIEAKLAQCASSHEQLLTILEALNEEPNSSSGRSIIQASAYPNPSADDINVSIDLDGARSVLIELYQSQSNLKVFSEKLVKDTSHMKLLNLSVLPRGLYLLRITAGREVRVIKIVKK